MGVWGVEERVEKDLPPLINQAIESIFDSLESRKKDIFTWLTKESTVFLEKNLQNFSNSITENRITRLQSILHNPKTTKFISQILQFFLSKKSQPLDLREFSDEIIETLLSLFQLLEEHLDFFILPSTTSNSTTSNSTISTSTISTSSISTPEKKSPSLHQERANSDDTDSLSKEISVILSQEILASLQKKSFWESFPIQNIVQKKNGNVFYKRNRKHSSENYAKTLQVDLPIGSNIRLFDRFSTTSFWEQYYALVQLLN